MRPWFNGARKQIHAFYIENDHPIKHFLSLKADLKCARKVLTKTKIKTLLPELFNMRASLRNFILVVDTKISVGDPSPTCWNLKLSMREESSKNAAHKATHDTQRSIPRALLFSPISFLKKDAFKNH